MSRRSQQEPVRSSGSERWRRVEAGGGGEFAESWRLSVSCFQAPVLSGGFVALTALIFGSAPQSVAPKNKEEEESKVFIS